MRKFSIYITLLFFGSCNSLEEGTIKTNSKIEKVDTAGVLDSVEMNDDIIIESSKQNPSDRIELFICQQIDKKTAFVSISDKYQLSEHSDSLAIPNSNNLNIDSCQYFQLNKKYRTRFFRNTKISDSYKMFVYDYKNELLREFKISDLNVVAKLNAYSSKDEYPFSQNDYMIGFELSNLSGFSQNFNNTLVYLGKSNPFNKNQLKQIQWQQIDSIDFPFEKATLKINHGKNGEDYQVGKMYSYKTDSLIYYTQDLITGNWTFAKRLIVLENQQEEKVFETIFYSGEGSSFASLDNQWTGTLFKNQPPVIFGFQWHSFGCPWITILNYNYENIPINCDNRH